MHLKQLQEDIKEMRELQRVELERIASMTCGEARKRILTESEEQVRHELAGRVRQLEEEAASEAKRRARNLVADALQRVAASAAAETTVTLVELPSDDMKGRIIGREGRNIRSLEHLTGVDAGQNQVGPRHQLQVFNNVLVADVLRDFLYPPVGKRMSRRRSQPQAIFAGQGNHVPAQLFHFFLGVFDVAANRSSDFDQQTVHLGLHPLLQQQLALFDNFRVDVGTQIARDRINGLIFFEQYDE